MARAHSIWVACSRFREPIAAFTVKRELIKWLDQRGRGPTPTFFYRMKDGGGSQKFITEQELRE